MFSLKDYVQPASLEEAYALRKKSKKNTILGGNLWRKMGTQDFNTGIDLCNLGLNTIEETEEEFRIGCMCSLRDLEIHEGLDQAFGGAFCEALRHIVGVQFRNTATVGGSLFPRFGFSDVLTVFAALDTYIELYQDGMVPIKEFIDRKVDDDILVRVIVKKDGRKAAYQSHRMTETDFAVLTCAASEKDGRYTLVYGARPHKAMVIENVDPEALDAAIDQVPFGSNMRGSAEYRKALAKVLAKRAFAAMA